MLIFFFQFGIVYSECTHFINDTLQIVSTSNEQIQFKYADIFKIEQNQTQVQYFDEYNVLSEIPPIHIINKTLINAPIIAYSIYQDNYQWNNKFAALIQNNENYQVLLSLNNTQGQSGRIPNFIENSPEIEALICNDLTFITNDKIIIDCFNNDKSNTLFWLYNKEFTQQITSLTYDENIQIKLLSSNQLLYRIITYESYSYIEIYDINGNILYELNSQNMTQILEKEYTLKILDIKISSIGEIAILNYNNDILLIRYSQKQQIWEIEYEFNSNSIIISFDFNFLNNKFIVLQENELILQTQFSQYQYSISSNQNSKIYLTDTMIILQNETSILLFNQQLELLQTIELQIQFIINDYTSNDLLFYTTANEILLISLNNQYIMLFYNNVIEPTIRTSKIIQNNCTLIIQHQTLELSKQFIISTGNKLYPQNIRTYPQQFKINLNQYQLFGPNLQYEFFYDNTTDIQIHLQYMKYSQIKLETINAQALYRNLLNNDLYNYIITQDNNYVIQFVNCTTQVNCFQIQLQQVNFQLNNQNCQIWNSINLLFLTYILDNTLIVTYIQDNIFKELFLIQLEQTPLQITRIKDTLVIRYNDKIEFYYISQVGYVKVFVADQELSINIWNPQNMYGSLISNYLFIINDVNKQELLILDCLYTQIKIIDQLYLDFQIDNILIFNNRFILLTNQNYLIYQIQPFVQFEKQLSTFGFQLTQYISHSFDGWIYIQSDTSLLIFNILKWNINTLYCILDKVQNQAISSSNNQLLLGQTLYNFYQDVIIQGSVNVNVNNLILTKQIQIKIINKGEDLIQQEQLNFLNSQTNIQINKQYYNLSTTLYQKKQINNCQSISNLWLQNNIVNLSLLCKDCYTNEIYIIPNIQQNTFQQESGIDFFVIDQFMIVTLYNDKLEIQDKYNGKRISDIQLNDQNCSRILFADNEQLILLCNTKKQQYLIQFSCELLECIQQDQQLILQNDNFITYFQLGIGKYLVYQEYIQILYYDNKTAPFNTNTSIQQYFYIGDFLIITNFEQQVFLYSFQINLQILQFTQDQVNYINFDLVNFLEINHFYYDCQDIVNLHIINQELLENNIISINHLLITKSNVHFVLNINYEYIQQNNKISIINVKLINILQNYGNWVAIQSQIKNNFITILYQNSTNYLLTLYDLTMQQNQFLNQSLWFIDGIYLEQNNINYKFINNNSILISNQQELYSIYYLKTYKQICLNGKIDQQIIQLIAQNDFNSISIEGLIEISYIYYGFFGMWVFIAVIVICTLIGCYYWRKRKQIKKAQTYLLE